MLELYFMSVKSNETTNGLYFYTGELAQMVERSLRMREARGSMPRFSTDPFILLAWFLATIELLQGSIISNTEILAKQSTNEVPDIFSILIYFHLASQNTFADDYL